MLKQTPLRPPARGSGESRPESADIERLELVIDRKISVADQVYTILREAIVDLRLAPGASISENSICRQFAVSRTPVRAAIQRLSEEGLVDVFPQLGSFVSPFRLESLRDSQFVRRSLEVALLREVAPHWTRAMSLRMRAVIAEQERLLVEDDPKGFLLADEEFHKFLAVFAGRESVWPAVLAAKVPLTRFHRYCAMPDRLRHVIEEHLAVVDALDRGDAAAAEHALTTHLDMIFVTFGTLPQEERRNLSP